VCANKNNNNKSILGFLHFASLVRVRIISGVWSFLLVSWHLYNYYHTTVPGPSPPLAEEEGARREARRHTNNEGRMRDDGSRWGGGTDEDKKKKKEKEKGEGESGAERKDEAGDSGEKGGNQRGTWSARQAARQTYGEGIEIRKQES
jgi:hypothetical protein